MIVMDAIITGHHREIIHAWMHYYELAYSQAFNQIKTKYIDKPEIQHNFDRFGFPDYGYD